MDLVRNHNGTENIWKLFPFLKKKFPKVYNIKNNSSNTMWMLVMFVSPRSRYRNASVQEKKQALQSDYSLEINWDLYKEEIELLEQMMLTKPQKYLVNWEKKLEERDLFMSQIPYDSETFEMLDKMMAATDKLWKQYRTALKDVEDADELTSKGGEQLSLEDQNII